MKLEMYEIRSELSNMFANILPPLKATAEKMVEEETGKRLIALCDQVDSLLFDLHRLLPREVEVVESAVKEMLGLTEEDEIETGLEQLIKDIQGTNEAVNSKEGRPIGIKDPFANKVWHRNGCQLKLLTGGKKEEGGPFNKDKGV